MKKYKNISEYIKDCPKDIQSQLQKIRKAIKEVAPKAEEAVSYGMPTFKLHGNLVHFAAFKTHFGFYPMPSGISAFDKELSKYDLAKGTIRFPLDKPVPIALIKKITKYCVQRNRENFILKQK